MSLRTPPGESVLIGCGLIILGWIAIGVLIGIGLTLAWIYL